jgi:hypothetical protein
VPVSPPEAVPESLSHLHSAWNQQYKTRPFRHAPLDDGARLGKDCDDREGFNDRLRVLGEVLDAMRPPEPARAPLDADGRQLQPIAAVSWFLLDQFPEVRSHALAAIRLIRHEIESGS